MLTNDIAAWVNEREAIRMRKAVLEDIADGGKFQLSHNGQLAWGEGSAARWSLDRLTSDPILSKYRFCNVRREDDRVTRWIREHIIVPYAQHEHLAIMLCVARTINWPPTLQRLIESPDGWPADSRFCPERMTAVLMDWQSRGEKVYTGAYMIRAESDKRAPWYSWPKQRYIAEIVIGKLWEQRYDWQHLDTDGTQSSQGVWEYLQMFTGWGPFMAGQVVTDLKHTRILENCSDWNTWTALGPGSRRGLNRLHSRPVKKALSQEEGLGEINDLKAQLDEPGKIWPWLQPMELADVQNCLCEFDKYERVRLGEGEPRARYVPGRGW